MYREQRNGYENQNRVIFDEAAGEYGIPIIKPVHDVKVDNWISFNFARTCEEPEIHGVHFFVDGYQFLRVWQQPAAYVDKLKQFQAVTSPDFSTYTDFPKAVQVYNHFRKHWLGAFWQMHGLTVIPTISWSDSRSFDWCFDGEPVGGMVVVSSVGTQGALKEKALFLDGYREMMARLRPDEIVFYGDVPDECWGNIIQVKSFASMMRKRLSSGV